jgi:hypothetical protein
VTTQPPALWLRGHDGTRWLPPIAVPRQRPLVAAPTQLLVTGLGRLIVAWFEGSPARLMLAVVDPATGVPTELRDPANADGALNATSTEPAREASLTVDPAAASSSPGPKARPRPTLYAKRLNFDGTWARPRQRDRCQPADAQPVRPRAMPPASSTSPGPASSASRRSIPRPRRPTCLSAAGLSLRTSRHERRRFLRALRGAAPCSRRPVSPPAAAPTTTHRRRRSPSAPAVARSPARPARKFVVPAGALAQPTSITIAQDKAGAPALAARQHVARRDVRLTPHGTAFAMPATLTIPFDPSLVPAGSTPTLLKTNAAQDGWDVVVGATVSGSTMQAPISSFSWTIIVIAPVLPTIAVQPADQSVVEPNAATFSVGATGPTLSGLLTFQWRRNGVAISGANSSSYSTGSDLGRGRRRRGLQRRRGQRRRHRAERRRHPDRDRAVVAPAIGQQPAMRASPSARARPSRVTSHRLPRSSTSGNARPTAASTFADIAGANAASLTVANAQATDSGLQFRVHLSNGAGSARQPRRRRCDRDRRAVATPGRTHRRRRRLLDRPSTVPACRTRGATIRPASSATAHPSQPLDRGRRSAPDRVRSVAAGGEYQGVAIRTDGTVWAWGYRGFVDCAVGSLASTPVPDRGRGGIARRQRRPGPHPAPAQRQGRCSPTAATATGSSGRPARQVPPMSPAAVRAGLPPIKAAAAVPSPRSRSTKAGDVWAWGRRPATAAAAPRATATPTKVAGLSA